MPELIKTPALVLESIRWHESSKIVTLFTRREGMLKAIARGALRSKSAFSGRLETLNVIQCIISQKESRELQILTQAELIDPQTMLKSDLHRLPYALSVVELLKKVFEKGQKDKIFFDFLLQIFQALHKSKQPEIVFWYFLLKLVSFLGFKPDFHRCFSCGQSAFLQGGWFVFKEGALLCSQCGSSVSLSPFLDDKTIYFLRRLQKYNHRKIHEFPWPVPKNTDLTSLILRYLSFHLGHGIVLESLKLLPA